MGTEAERIEGGAYAAPTGRTRPRGTWWVLALVVVVAAAGIGAWLLWPKASPLDLSTQPVHGLSEALSAEDERVRARQKVGDGVVTVAADGTVRSFDRDGDERWTAKVPDGEETDVGIFDATDDGAVVIAFTTPDHPKEPGSVLLEPSLGPIIPPNPRLVWLGAEDGRNLGHVTWQPEEVPVQSDDQRLYGFNRKHGELVAWSGPHKERWKHRVSPFAPGDNEPMLHQVGGRLILDDGLTAEVLVRGIVDRESGASVDWLGEGEHVAANDALLRVERGALVGRDWRDGDERWRIPIGAEQVTVQGGEVFLLTGPEDGARTVRAIDAADGTTRWTKPDVLHGWIEVVGDEAFLMAGDDQLLAVGLESGEARKLTQRPAGGAEVSGTPVFGDDAYLTMGLAGNALIVTSRSLEDGAELWTEHIADAWTVDEFGGWAWAGYDDESAAFARLR